MLSLKSGGSSPSSIISSTASAAPSTTIAPGNRSTSAKTDRRQALEQAEAACQQQLQPVLSALWRLAVISSGLWSAVVF